MNKSAFIIALIVALYASSADAQFIEGFTGEVAADGAVTTGNTETTNLGFRIKLATATEQWRHSFKSSAQYGRANGSTNKSRYDLGYQLDRDVNDRMYFFGNADYFSHDFGAFKQGHYLGAGLGYQALEEDPARLRLEAGLGYRSQKSRLQAGNPLGVASTTKTELASRFVSDFDYAFNEKVSFRNDTELLYSNSDTFITNESGIKSKLWENISLLASFRVENHSEVPDGREKTDTISRLGVVYTMK